MSCVEHLDELVKEYLLFRRFNLTLKSFENEIKSEKEKGYRVEKLLDLMTHFISGHDLLGLRDLWTHLNTRLFSRLEQTQASAVQKLETSVLKLYLVNCVQTKHNDKVREFFQHLSADLHGHPEWKDWFALPFLPNPESNPTFAPYFTRQWQDTLMLSLFNFLSLVFSSVLGHAGGNGLSLVPRLAQYQSTTARLRKMREENETMKSKLTALENVLRSKHGLTLNDVTCPEIFPPDEVMDDFCIIAQEASTSTESQAKTLKSFLRTFTGGGGTSTTVAPSPNPSHGSSSFTSSSSDRKSLTGGRQSSSSSSSQIQQQQQPAPRSSKSRSSSKSRAPSHHAPVKRVSQSSMLGTPTPSSSSGVMATSALAASTLMTEKAQAVSSNRSSQLSDDLERFSNSSGLLAGDGGDELGVKMAYLLLGQEEYLEHRSEVTHCKFSSSGYVIASSDTDGIIKTWSSTPAPQTLATFISQGSAVTALDWVKHSERHFLYGTENGIVRLCDKDERKTVKELQFEDQEISTIACSPNASHCVIALTKKSTAESSLMLYDMKTMVLEHDLSEAAPISELTACVFNHNSQLAISSGVDGKVRIFDLRRKDCISSWSAVESPGSSVVSLALSQDETSIYALSERGNFSGWSLYQTGQKLFEYQLDDSYFQDLSSYPRTSWSTLFSLAGDGKHLLTCSVNGGIIYEFNHNDKFQKILGLKGHAKHTTCTDWSSANDCGPCITAGSDGQIRVSTLLSQ